HGALRPLHGGDVVLELGLDLEDGRQAPLDRALVGALRLGVLHAVDVHVHEDLAAGRPVDGAQLAVGTALGAAADLERPRALGVLARDGGLAGARARARRRLELAAAPAHALARALHDAVARPLAGALAGAGLLHLHGVARPLAGPVAGAAEGALALAGAG